MIKRRQPPLEFKQQVVAESSRRGASVAGVAMVHGINANQLHKWRRDLLRLKPSATPNALVPVTVDPAPIMIGAPTSESCPGAIEIELPQACSGQVFSDTQIGFLSSHIAFITGGRQVTSCRVQA
jgi:hypothetical protein